MRRIAGVERIHCLFRGNNLGALGPRLGWSPGDEFIRYNGFTRISSYELFIGVHISCVLHEND